MIRSLFKSLMLIGLSLMWTWAYTGDAGFLLAGSAMTVAGVWAEGIRRFEVRADLVAVRDGRINQQEDTR